MSVLGGTGGKGIGSSDFLRLLVDSALTAELLPLVTDDVRRAPAFGSNVRSSTCLTSVAK